MSDEDTHGTVEHGVPTAQNRNVGPRPPAASGLPRQQIAQSTEHVYSRMRNLIHLHVDADSTRRWGRRGCGVLRRQMEGVHADASQPWEAFERRKEVPLPLEAWLSEKVLHCDPIAVEGSDGSSLERPSWPILPVLPGFVWLCPCGDGEQQTALRA